MPNLLKKACGNCPYRLGSSFSKTLNAERKQEFWESHVSRQEFFYCHETCESIDEVYTEKKNGKSALCFGALAAQWRAHGGFNFYVSRLATQGRFIPEKMSSNQYPDSLQAWINDTELGAGQ